MIAIEAFFVVRAVATFPGEDVPNSYVLGLDYNRTLARRAKQDRLGWRVEAGIESNSMLVVRFENSDGIPLDRLDVSAVVHRSGQSGEGEQVGLKQRSPGEYAAPVNATGRIRISIEARRAGEGEPAFQAAKTLVAS
jgi:nitrogen fixation protein FixH